MGPTIDIIPEGETEPRGCVPKSIYCGPSELTGVGKKQCTITLVLHLSSQPGGRDTDGNKWLHCTVIRASLETCSDNGVSAKEGVISVVLYSLV